MSTIATDYMELALKLREALKLKDAKGYEHRKVIADVRELILVARKLQRFAEKDCNTGLTQADQQEIESIQVRMTALLSKYSITPLFGGDPRGAVFKLKLPSGETNDFGGEGWCVPR